LRFFFLTKPPLSTASGNVLEELPARLWVGGKRAEEALGGGGGSRLQHAPHTHAHVPTLHHHSAAFRGDCFVQGFRDLKKEKDEK
jgi:hypothetical protein